LAEVFGLNVFMWIASAQYAVPVLRNSLDKMASLDLPSILERLMKLSTISLVIWLAGFFALFQSFLNALAEIMKFGFTLIGGTLQVLGFIGEPGINPCISS
jgi:diacylglycerol O-acyltransferase-1